MRKTVAEIAEQLGGIVEGDPEAVITGVAAVHDAVGGELAFVANPKYAGAAASTGATAVLVARDWAAPCPATLIRVDNPSLAFSDVVAEIAPGPAACAPGVHASAVVAEDVRLGDGVSVQPCAVVESGTEIGDHSVIGAGVFVGRDCRIGADSLLYPGVVVRERCEIGARVIVHPGAVIGSDGFGYETVDGVHRKIPQVGIVRIEDDVEIGAGVTIDRARFGATWIRHGTKIDNLVQIAHNVVIGENSIVVSQVGIAGSSRIGAGVTLAGQSGVAGHVVVGDGVIVGGRGGVTKDVAPGEYVMGFPATSHKQHRRIHAHVQRLPRLVERVRELEAEVERLHARLDCLLPADPGSADPGNG